jgi:hypothetical protein
MATTTNYGWTTPDDTALVKDGAAAIRTLGSSVDSTLKTQIDNTVTSSIVKSTITTKGDLIVGTGAGTFVRRGVGTNGQVLTADSGQADGVIWATPFNALTLSQIATGTLSGASVTVSTLSAYDTLIVAIYGTTNNTAAGITKVRINNNSGANYATFGFYTDQNYAVTGNDAVFINPNNLDRTVNANSAIIKFTNCRSAGFTDFDLSSRIYTGANQVASLAGVYGVAEAVSSLVILNTGGNWAGGTYTVWGG